MHKQETGDDVLNITKVKNVYQSQTTEPSSRWRLVSLLLIFTFIIYVGSSLYSYYSLQTQYTDLQDQYSTLQMQLQGNQQEIQRLGQYIDIANYLNLSDYLPIPKIFELIKDSVVLIKTKVFSGFELIDHAQGSGFVYDRNGHIITNDHMIDGADEISVTFTSGNVSKATIVGRDPYSDIAIIKVTLDPELLHPIVFGNSSALVVGEPVVALGNPFGLRGTITAGIVSQVGRDLSAPGNYRIIDVIQLDAAINPGNSGGPLVNMWGEVVGMNTAIISGATGVGFAIPSDTIKREIPSLVSIGSYAHPWLGITGSDVDPDIAAAEGLHVTYGILIADVLSGSPASAAGVRGNDVLIGIDGVIVRNFNDLSVYLERNTTPGTEIAITIMRNDQKIVLQVVLGQRPLP